MCKDFTIPRPNIIVKLNKLLEETLLEEIVGSNSTTEELIKKADIEKNIRKAIFKSPENPVSYAKLCSFLRELGKPKQALIETDNIPIEKSAPLLVSRAGVMCDLGQYLKAKKEIAPVLSSCTVKSKEYAFSIVNRIKKEAPELYDEFFD